MRRLAEIRTDRLAGAAKLLQSLSYKSVLSRGFAVVRDAKGQPLHAAAAIKPAQSLQIEFADGVVKAKEDSGPKQGSLF